MVLGLDISHWNTVTWPDWPDKRFVYIKASEGTDWTDDKMASHKAAAEAADKYTGPYHYFRAAFNGAVQAQHFFDTAGPDWDMPPAIDVEVINNTGFSKEVFAARLRNCLQETERLFRRRPVIYTSKSKWDLLVGFTGWESAYDLWAAHYTTAPVPLIPTGWSGKGWTLWQHTSTPLDQDRFGGSEEEFLEFVNAAPPVGGDLETRVKKLEGDVVALLALTGRLHDAHHA